VEAFDIIQAAKAEGVTNPDIFVARLKRLPGMTTERAGEILSLEGIQTDGLIDPRLTTVGSEARPRGFAS